MYLPSDGLLRPILRKIPIELMRYTTNLETEENFQRSGFEVYTMLNAASVKHSGKSIHQHGSILDFGCGAGRIMQFLPFETKFSGCDVNRRLVDFTLTHFPKADIYQNNYTPPLKWADESFDLIYSFSVFSHLRQVDENAWLEELARVGRPCTLYLITIHGDWFIEATSGADRAMIEAAGFYYREVHARHGSDMDFPEGYEVSYHTSKFIYDNWSTNFDVIEIYRGDRPNRYLWDGMPEYLRTDLNKIRPMGQDLVVMRRR